MLLNFPRCLSILLLQTSKTNNNALALTLFITSNLEKLAELRQIVSTAILLAHSDISSSTTAHNNMLTVSQIKVKVNLTMQHKQLTAT
jgi:hypothetical protein